MGEKIIFDYFYGQESEMHAFYRVPKLLFTNAHFKKLSSDAKILYGLMLDRMSLSQKNKWLDAENRAYIIYSQLEAMEMLNCKENKAINLFRELEAIGLLERRKQGQGKPSLIYLKDFVQEQILEKTSSEEKCSDMGKIKVKNLEKTMSGDGKKQGLDMGKTNANYNNINNNNLVIHTNHIYSMNQDMNDEYSAYAEIVRENLDIDSMSERYPQDVDIIEGIYDLVLETVLCRKSTIWISKNEYPTNLVKSKFLKLNHMHLEYVMGCMKDNTTKVRNIKNYLLSALFNAPTTMGSYYQAEYMYDRVRKAE